MANYGTTNSTTPSHRQNNDHTSNNERDAILPGGHPRANKSSDPTLPLTVRFQKHMMTKVTKKHGDLVLLCCYIFTGLLDSAATAIWGAFVSMQTGNTVYLGLGIADPHASTRWLKSLTSIVCFCLGSFCFARFHRRFSPRRRWVLVVSFLAQMGLVVGAAVVVTVTPASVPGNGHDLHWHVLVPLGMVAFQSSGQAVTSRALQYGGLTSVVLTSNYCDLFSDAQLFAGLSQNVERNRRAAAPVLLLIGVVVGGLWAKSEVGIAGALWTAAVLKAFVALAWLLWKADDEAGED